MARRDDNARIEMGGADAADRGTAIVAVHAQVDQRHV
jgi:hypothetical protein